MKLRAYLVIAVIFISSLMFFNNPILDDNLVSAQPIFVGVGSTYTSIQDAVDNATSGDVIYVANGTYNGSITISTPDITLMGNSSTDCTIVYAYAGSDIFNDYASGFNISSNNITISGFNISVSGSYTYGLYLNSSAYDITIKNNVITASGVGSGGLVVDNSNDNIILNNMFYTNGTAGNGITVNSATGLRLEDNSIQTENALAHGLNVSNSAGIVADRLYAGTIDASATAVICFNSILDIFNSTLNASTGIDAELQLDSNASFTNVSFNNVNLTTNLGGSLWVYNYLDVLVLANETLVPMQGADVLVLDNDNSVYNSTGYGGADPVTDPAGEIRTLRITDRWYPKSDTPVANKTTVRVTRTLDAAWEEERDVDMTNSHTETFMSSDITAPGIPSGLNVTQVQGESRMNLSWDASIDDTVTYSIYTNRSGSWVHFRNVTHPETIANDTFLFFHGDVYYYRISAWDEVPIESPLSSPVFVKFNDDVAPVTPGGLSASPIINGDSLNISWIPNIDDTLTYSIYSNRSGGWQIIANITHPMRYFIDDSDLVHGVRYYYRISAWDEVPLESNLSQAISTVHEDQKKPVAPIGLNITNITGTSIELKWQPNNESDLQGYMVFINATGSGSGGPYLNLTIVDANKTGFTAQNLTEEITYYFVIRAFDEVPLFSDQSNEVWNTTRDSTPPEPPLLSVLPEYTNDTELVVHGFTEANATIKVLVNAVEGGTGTSDNTGEFNAIIDLVEGSNIITVFSIDRAGNPSEKTQPKDVVLDTVAPSAFAGKDIIEGMGYPVELDGSGSFDDHSGIGNYSWRFKADNVTPRLYGVVVHFVFERADNYTIILRVTDFAGNWHEDDIVIRVVEGPVDRIPPAIERLYPPAGGMNIPVRIVVEIEFDEVIDLVSFEFNLSGLINTTLTRAGSYDVVPGELEYDIVNLTMTYTPYRNLLYNQTYFINISVRDDFENWLRSIWNFTTELKPTEPPDTKQPTVNLTEFTRKNKRLPVDEQIIIPFTEGLNNESIIITIVDDKNITLEGGWVYDDDAFTVVFTPNDPLSYNTLYTITIYAEDNSGNPLTPETRTLTFTTEKEEGASIPTFFIWLMATVILIVIILIIAILAIRRRNIREFEEAEPDEDDTADLGPGDELEDDMYDEDEELDDKLEFGDEAERPRVTVDEVECPQCGAYITRNDEYCFTCGWDPKLDGSLDEGSEEE